MRPLPAPRHQTAVRPPRVCAQSIEVDVSCGPWSEYASWLGGSLMAGGATPEGMLQAATTSRAHWQEHGSLLGADCIE